MNAPVPSLAPSFLSLSVSPISLSLQVLGDTADGLRPKQHHQVTVTDRRTRPAPHIPDPEGTEGTTVHAFVHSNIWTG